MTSNKKSVAVPATLVVESLVQLGTCASFLYVGATLRHREQGASLTGTSLAARAFVTWWWSLGVYLGMQGALGLLAAAGYAPLGLHLGARIVVGPLLGAAAWGICTYVLFLYTGRRWVFPVTTAYAVVAALAFVAETFLDPHSEVSVTAWGAGLAPPVDRTLMNAVYAFFAIPLVASTLAYASLYARVRDPIQRYRVALVSGSIFAWVVGGFAGASSGDLLAQFVAVTLLGLATAGAVILAYRPPGAVSARLAPESPEGRAHLRRVAERRALREERARTL